MVGRGPPEGQTGTRRPAMPGEPAGVDRKVCRWLVFVS